MSKINHRWVRWALALCLVMVLTLAIAQPTRAQGIIYGDTVPSGETVENDAILFGSEVVLDGTVEGDVLAIGETVNINGRVGGSLVVVGQTVTINGQVDGTVYIAAVTLELSPEAALNHNLYYAGVSLEAKPGSTIGRDVFGIMLGAQFGGTLERDVKAIIGPVEIIKIIMNWVNGLREGSNLLPLPTPTPGSLIPEQDGIALASLQWIAYRNNVDSAPLNSFQAQNIYRQSQALAPQAQAVVNWFLARFRYFVTLLVVGGLGVWLLPKPFAQWSDLVRSKPLPALGLGFVTLITGFVGVIILSVLVMAIGFALGFLTLWDLAFIVFSLGFSILSLSFSVFLLFVLYMSKAIVAYLIGLLILRRLTPKAAEHRVWPLLLGLFLFVLLSAIPYFVGSLIAFLATLLGLGAIWLGFSDSRRSAKQVSPEASIPTVEAA